METNIPWDCAFPYCREQFDARGYFCQVHAEYRPLERALFHKKVNMCPDEERALTAVYVIGSDRVDAVKIGIAVDIQQRIASLQTGFPFPLELYSALYTSRKMAARLEAAVHTKLRELDVHLNGEWFDLEPEDAAKVIRKVAATEALPVLSAWDYMGMTGWSRGDEISHETFSLSATCRQLLRDNVVRPFNMTA